MGAVETHPNSGEVLPIDRRDEAAELQTETIRVAIHAVLGLAFVLLGFAAIGLNRIDPTLFGIVAGLAALFVMSRSTFDRRPKIAAGIVVIGLMVILTGALATGSGNYAAPWFAVVVFVTFAVLDWQAAGVTAAVASVLLLGAHSEGVSALSADVTLNGIAVIWGAMGAAWLISRPTRTAIAWSWASYSQALAQTQVARQRQAELVRVSKSLGESYYQMEQLNLELEQARHVAQEARRLKAQFAAAVSHELRTPLNLIIGFCEMMVLTPSSAYGHRLPQNYHDDLEAIYRNAGHISALVDDILDLSQIDADRMALHREWASLEQIVGEAISTVATLFRDRELYLRTTLSPLPALYVDETRVRQILINLLSNAARFIDQGGVTIAAITVDGSVVLSVTDTGPGIPTDDLPGVFEEFYQVGGTRRRGGSGLGLTISKRFAELHGGTMWVESRVGVGSTFCLRLPLDIDEPAVAGEGLDWNDRIGRRVRGDAERRLLVLDDDGQVHKVFQRYLDGFQVLNAISPNAARKIARSTPLHSVVLGSNTAVTAWSRIVGTDHQLGRIPTITCALRTPRRTADDLGVADYLVKPVTRDQLRGALKRLGNEVHRVLIVDDDSEMTRLLTRMIRALVRGCQVWTASDGREALAAMREHAPDLTLLDLLMPGLNGYATLEAMRADPALAGLTVVVITARGLQDEAVIASDVSIAREGGLTVAEIMRWVRTGLDAITATVPEMARAGEASRSSDPL